MGNLILQFFTLLVRIVKYYSQRSLKSHSKKLITLEEEGGKKRKIMLLNFIMQKEH